MSENEEEWQLSKSSIMERIGYIYSNQLLTDIEIVVGPKGAESQETFHAHKFILIVSSSVFADVLRNLSDENQSQIFFPDISPRGFSNLLKYLYTDELQLKNIYEAMEICKTAHRFEISILKNRFSEFFSRTILSAQNACKILEIANLLENARLKNKCLQFTQNNTESVLKSDGFRTIDLETVKNILELEIVSVASEAPLIEAALEWGQHQCTSIDRFSIRLIIRPLMPFLNFNSLSVGELARIIENFKGVFTEKESVACFMNIASQSDLEISKDKTGGRIYRSGAEECEYFWSYSFPSLTEDFSFHLNYEKAIQLQVSDYSFSIFLKFVRETVVIRGIKLSFKSEGRTVKNVTKNTYPKVQYTVSVLWGSLFTPEIVAEEDLFNTDESLIIFSVPLTLSWSLFVKEMEIRVDVSVKGDVSFPVLIAEKEDKKSLDPQTLCNIGEAGPIWPFSYRVKSPFHKTFIISNLYYSVG